MIDIDIDKYIDWYKNECRQSDERNYKQWELVNRVSPLLSYIKSKYTTPATNGNCKRRYKFLMDKFDNYNNGEGAIYDSTEWLIPTQKQWNLFDRMATKNSLVFELDRLLLLTKETVEAKVNVINQFIKKFKRKELIHRKSYLKYEVPTINFFEKSRYEAIENNEYMGYCIEQAFFGLLKDYEKIKAVDYAKRLIQDITSTNDIESIDKPIKWIGKPAQFGFIMNELAEKGFIEAPTKKDGEINYSQFAKELFKAFDLKTTQANLAKELNPNKNSLEYENKDNLTFPHIKEIS